MKNRVPDRSNPANTGRTTTNNPKPTTVPTPAATVDSTAANTATCRELAPTNRNAANRCSRRAADNRVAAPINTNTGKINASPVTSRINAIP
ncbi:hypothetical protein GCM10027589_33910 [Actinocorallia lasiicapitis]